MPLIKPRLSFSQIINMNVGFFGIQYSFALQQNAVNPIYKFLGAENEWLYLFSKDYLKSNKVDFFVFGHRHLPLDLDI